MINEKYILILVKKLLFLIHMDKNLTINSYYFIISGKKNKKEVKMIKTFKVIKIEWKKKLEKF